MAIVVKFIVTDNRVIFGDRHFRRDYHDEVAKRAGIRLSEVRGGGLADLEAKRIFGTSCGLGPYNPETVRRLLPEWKVEEPSDYD